MDPSELKSGEGIVELSEAVKQREELPRTAISPLAAASEIPDSNDTNHTGSELQEWVPTKSAPASQEELYNPYADYTNDHENEDDMKQTSPILSRGSVSFDGGRHSMSAEVGWAM